MSRPYSPRPLERLTFPNGKLDELVLLDCNIHLERMDSGEFCLLAYKGKGKRLRWLNIMLTSKARIEGCVQEDEFFGMEDKGCE